MKINIIFINLLIIFFVLVLILIFIFVKNKTQHKTIESPFEHIYNENCDPVSGSLKSCNTIGETCLECGGGNDGKSGSQPRFASEMLSNIYSCQEVKYARDNEGNILPGETDKWKIYKSQEKDYISSENSNQLGVIPEGRWCLPVKVDKINCNPYTSDSILTKINDNHYRWRCKCKFPQYITSDNLDGDCDIQIACNHQEDPDNNYLVYCADGSKTCSNPIKWDNSSKVGLDSTFCNCNKDSFPYNNDTLNVKTCLKDPCGGLGTYNTKFQDCNCNEGSINVKNLPSNHAQEYEGIGCILDPCENGKYDITSKSCVCNKGYTLIRDENFISNGYCVKDDNVCEDTPNSTARDCISRGGYCEPKMVSLGYGDRVIPVPQCKGCLPSFGFRNGRDADCTRALLNFVDCNDDSQCSSGRCHESGGLFGIGSSRMCAPCNDPGDFIENQNISKQRELQSDYDKKCRDLGTGQFCNLYSDTKDGENLHPEYGKYLGVCENTKDSPGSSRLNGKEFKRY